MNFRDLKPLPNLAVLFASAAAFVAVYGAVRQDEEMTEVDALLVLSLVIALLGLAITLALLATMDRS